MKTFMYDLIAWLAGVAIVLSFFFWAANVKAAEADLDAPLTLELRTGIIAGVLMGIDMSLAIKNEPPMTNDQAYRIATTIHQGTLQCTLVKCMLANIAQAVKSVRAASQQKKQFPLEGEILR